MEEIAQVYARSLFEVALEHDVLDEIHEQLAEVADTLAENRELQVFFFSPYFSTHEKKEGVRRVVTGANEQLLNFLELLAEKHRMPVIFRIRRAFDARWEEENRILPVEVTSAVELDDETVAEIGHRIEQSTGRRVDMETRVDPDVIGGLVLQVGNKVVDASIRARLERLRKEVAQAA
jgi:F-type H+-transporting ATPase subunit delta